MAEWQRAISSREFAEWVAYAQLEPFGPARADWRAGLVASVIANVNRDPKKRAKPWIPGDFIPTFEAADPEPAPMDGRALFAKLKQGLGLNRRGGEKQNGDPE